MRMLTVRSQLSPSVAVQQIVCRRQGSLASKPFIQGAFDLSYDQDTTRPGLLKKWLQKLVVSTLDLPNEFGGNFRQFEPLDGGTSDAQPGSLVLSKPPMPGRWSSEQRQSPLAWMERSQPPDSMCILPIVWEILFRAQRECF